MQHQVIHVQGVGPVTYSEFVARLFKPMDKPEDQLMHAAVGISGEAGELLDAVKKHWAYGKELDMTNVREELGDIMFYMVALMNRLGIDAMSVVAENAAKLAKRYPGATYSNEAAIARADKEAGQ